MLKKINPNHIETLGCLFATLPWVSEYLNGDMKYYDLTILNDEDWILKLEEEYINYFLFTDDCNVEQYNATYYTCVSDDIETFLLKNFSRDVFALEAFRVYYPFNSIVITTYIQEEQKKGIDFQNTDLYDALLALVRKMNSEQLGAYLVINSDLTAAIPFGLLWTKEIETFSISTEIIHAINDVKKILH